MSTSEKIKVMQAFDSGESVQFRPKEYGTAKWQEAVEPSWDWWRLEYRIKPKTPLRIFLNMYRDGLGTSYFPSRKEAENVGNMSSDVYLETVEFVQVIKDE